MNKTIKGKDDRRLLRTYNIIGYDSDGLPLWETAQGSEDWLMPFIPDYACQIMNENALINMPEQSQSLIYCHINPLTNDHLLLLKRALKAGGRVIIVKKPEGKKQ